MNLQSAMRKLGFGQRPQYTARKPVLRRIGPPTIHVQMDGSIVFGSVWAESQARNWHACCEYVSKGLRIYIQNTVYEVKATNDEQDVMIYLSHSDYKQVVKAFAEMSA